MCLEDVHIDLMCVDVEKVEPESKGHLLGMVEGMSVELVWEGV